MVNFETNIDQDSLTRLTADVVAAYVGNNLVSSTQLPSLIHSVYRSLSELSSPVVDTIVEQLKPAVPIKKSITPDFLVCLEDGKKLKMLKRYLRSTYDLTPDAYRARWGLAPDYPMVAPNYAAQRSEFAKTIGLGKGVGRAKSARRSTKAG